MSTSLVLRLVRRALTIIVALSGALSFLSAQQRLTPDISRYRADADRLIDAALSDTTGYSRLGYLVDTFGSRLSGSASLEAALDWVIAQMKSDGLDDAHGEPVMVRHWVRGRESAELIQPRRYTLHMIGLGGSVGTPPNGITAPVLVVNDFDELKRRAAEAKGKIVLFDHPFATDKAPFDAYSEGVVYRGRGATEAARVGAVASLIRSVASFSIQNPHTGSMSYQDTTVGRIPAAALSIEDAEMLHWMQRTRSAGSHHAADGSADVA